MPFGGGCGPGTNANYKYQLCKIYCVMYLEIFSILQSKQCLRRLNLTFQASHTWKSSDYAFGTSRPTTSFNSARSELSAVYKNGSDTLQRSQSAATNCQRKALLSSSLLQPISITRGKKGRGLFRPVCDMYSKYLLQTRINYSVPYLYFASLYRPVSTACIQYL